jgi:hypothetical protein
MIRFLSVCVAAALMMACATRYQRARTITIIGGTVTLASGAATVSAANNDPEEAITIATWFMLPSLVMLLTGATWMKMAASEDEVAEQRRAEALRTEQARAQHEALVRTRDRAWLLTQEAIAAARAGNCLQVGVFDREVRASDAEFHATVFARNVAIQRCLAPR